MVDWMEIISFNDKFFPNWRDTNPIFYSNALAGEVGEICNIIKKLNGGGTNDNRKIFKKSDILIEAIDVYIYLSLLIMNLGFTEDDFDDAFYKKLNIWSAIILVLEIEEARLQTEADFREINKSERRE